MFLKNLILGLLICAVFSSATEAANTCAKRELSTGIVCVCNSTYCDTVDPLKQLRKGLYVAYETNKEGLRLEKSVAEYDIRSNGDYELVVNDSKTYQTIHGFGGSFTDSFAINYLNLSRTTREKLIRSYFSDEGSEYNLCRVPIAGTDFSTHGYTYDDTENDDEDVGLSNFSLKDEDYTYKIPLVKVAQNLAKNNIKLLASPWSAPKWMKTRKQYAGMFSFVKSEYYQAWADYILRFLREYKEQDIEFWGLTTGNEPSLAFFIGNRIPTNGWLPNNLRKWIGENLGPTIRNSEFSKIKLLGIDDQNFFYPWYPKYLLNDEKVAEYLDGFSVHWYWNIIFGRSFLKRASEEISNKFVISSEACSGSYLVTPHVILGSWIRGLLYAIDIIEDLNRNVTGWIDWNMALDTTGGPTYIGNNVDSPIIVNAEQDEFYKNPMYYSIIHFSKFIPPGSVRIELAGSVSGLYSVAFRRPDKGTTIVLINRSNNQIAVSVKDPSRGSINLNITAKSFTTVVYW
ncbi:glucosylceramidase-like [Agrilus planipennis]|uniref:Glucosylceramidase n=1 Tax=Agrilus planipennis TaxID=224129 RepID=A0A1W4WRP8_AGRPL|nr:glucosylceramidase-like [Agrilus planipennis]